MSRMLTMIDAGWQSVLSLAASGQKAKALEQLTRLLALPNVPAKLATEGNRLAGELSLDLERYAAARRYLKAAAGLDSDHAGTRHAMGRAWEEDPDGCDRRAAICFKKAVALDPANPAYRAAFGRAAARCGKVKLGTREMIAAAEAAAGDIAVIRVAVVGLLEMGKAKAARRVVAAARFHNPGCAELAAAWERVKFETARLSQRTTFKARTREYTRDAQDAHFATEGDRVTLPFVHLVGAKGGGGAGGTVRRDAASFPRPHVARLRARKADC